MSILSDTDYADLWATYEEGLTDRCDLRAPVETTVSNQTAKTWPAVTTANVRCALLDGIGAPGSSQDYANSDLPNSRTVMLPRTTTIDVGWRIEPPTGRWAGSTFEVLRAQQPGTTGPAVQCECVEVQP